MTTLNDQYLASNQDIYRAADKVLEATVSLRLTEAQMRDLFQKSVISLLMPGTGGTLKELTNYATGLLDGYARLIVCELCEFVYHLDRKPGTGVYGLSLKGPHSHFSRLTMSERRKATCGYAWKDSDGLSTFTAFGPDPALELLARS